MGFNEFNYQLVKVGDQNVVQLAMTEGVALYLAEILTEKRSRIRNRECPDDAWCGEQDAFIEGIEIDLDAVDSLLLQLCTAEFVKSLKNDGK